jgi:hypothetical protein
MPDAQARLQAHSHHATALRYRGRLDLGARASAASVDGGRHGHEIVRNGMVERAPAKKVYLVERGARLDKQQGSCVALVVAGEDQSRTPSPVNKVEPSAGRDEARSDGAEIPISACSNKRRRAE